MSRRAFVRYVIVSPPFVIGCDWLWSGSETRSFFCSCKTTHSTRTFQLSVIKVQSLPLHEGASSSGESKLLSRTVMDEVYSWIIFANHAGRLSWSYLLSDPLTGADGGSNLRKAFPYPRIDLSFILVVDCLEPQITSGVPVLIFQCLCWATCLI